MCLRADRFGSTRESVLIGSCGEQPPRVVGAQYPRVNAHSDDARPIDMHARERTHIYILTAYSGLTSVIYARRSVTIQPNCAVVENRTSLFRLAIMEPI